MRTRMLATITHFLMGDVIVANRDETTKQNRLALRYFAIAGVPVGLANVVAQSIIRGTALLSLDSLWLPTYYVVLLLLERFLIPANYKNATLLAYVIEAPALLVSILLGTVWDPTHQAITFLMIMVTAPVFILDRPIRMLGIMLAWNVLFVLMCAAFKDPSTFRPDLIHALEFFLASMGVTYVVLGVRLESLRNLERTRYHLEHDVLTDTQNQRSLAAHADNYVGKQIFISMGDIDHFKLLNDFYGHEVGDDLLFSFAGLLKDLYGKERVYRYGGDEMLCILVGKGEDGGLALVKKVQEQLLALRPQQIDTRLTCSFGYSFGSVTSDVELRQMIQLANIYAHQAKRQGEGKVIGGAYNSEALRAGIIESNVATHARAYEINQLTDLPSVAYFITRAEELLQHIIVMERRPTVGFVNLVHFHDFNNTFGYSQGDKLIRKMADLLRTYLPKRHIAYISGSQFAVLCYQEEIDPFMQNLSRSLQEYMPGHAIVAKAGFAEYEAGNSVIALLDSAKLAHDSIVENRSTTYRIYDHGLDEEVRLRQYLISHLDEAVSKDWIKVYYQPIVHAASGEICNMEALARWDDPKYGFLPPFRFISVLERERIIYKLTLCMVRRIMRDFRRLEKNDIPLVPVSVNLSRNDFFECDIVEEIRAIVDESGYSRRLLNIEITESAFADDQGLLKSEVDRFRALGFAVWMDDFGSEYSTLNLLEHLNFDLIKIDMQFMRNFTSESKNAIILADIVGMCRRLGITTLVEGVETQEQYEALKQFGTDKLQGYLFSRPRSLDDLFGQLAD